MSRPRTLRAFAARSCSPGVSAAPLRPPGYLLRSRCRRSGCWRSGPVCWTLVARGSAAWSSSAWAPTVRVYVRVSAVLVSAVWARVIRVSAVLALAVWGSAVRCPPGAFAAPLRPPGYLLWSWCRRPGVGGPGGGGPGVGGSCVGGSGAGDPGAGGQGVGVGVGVDALVRRPREGGGGSGRAGYRAWSRGRVPRPACPVRFAVLCRVVCVVASGVD